jgi:hypothetical protein
LDQRKVTTKFLRPGKQAVVIVDLWGRGRISSYWQYYCPLLVSRFCSFIPQDKRLEFPLLSALSLSPLFIILVTWWLRLGSQIAVPPACAAIFPPGVHPLPEVQGTLTPKRNHPPLFLWLVLWFLGTS